MIRARKTDALRKEVAMVSKHINSLVNGVEECVSCECRYKVRCKKSKRPVGPRVEITQFAHGGWKNIPHDRGRAPVGIFLFSDLGTKLRIVIVPLLRSQVGLPRVEDSTLWPLRKMFGSRAGIFGAYCSPVTVDATQTVICQLD